jgi:homocysteine S-methyltransferase
MLQRLHHALPQLAGGLFLSDSGMETTLVFHEGRDLPAFAAFPLLEEEAGRRWLDGWYDRHLAIAERHGAGFVIDTPTWRANPDWGAGLGFDARALARVNAAAVAFCRGVRDRWAARVAEIVVAGTIGPRGDGYAAGTASVAEAEDYHAPQIEAFAASGADQATAYTLGGVGEAVGIARAASAAGLPVTISFTVETDGRLADGTPLGAAIEAVDDATGGSPAYYMLNCAHPVHFADVLQPGSAWLARLRGVKANASTLSHAELDVMETLDDGDPDDLGARYRALAARLPRLAVIGGCCGTDHRHVAAMAACCTGGVGAEPALAAQ